MEWLGIIMFIIIFICSIASWINSKIILEELDGLKKALKQKEVDPASAKQPDA